MWTVAAISFWRTRSPSRLAWSEGWRPPRRWVCSHQMNRVNSRNGFAIMTAPSRLLLLLLLLLLFPTAAVACVAPVGERPSETSVHSSSEEDELSRRAGGPLQALEGDTSGLGRWRWRQRTVGYTHVHTHYSGQLSPLPSPGQGCRQRGECLVWMG